MVRPMSFRPALPPVVLRPALASLPRFAAADRLAAPLRRTALLYLILIAALFAWGFFGAWSPLLRSIFAETTQGGLLAIVLGALLPAYAGLAVTASIVTARRRSIGLDALPLPPVSRAAAWPQALALLAAAAMAGLGLWWFWPSHAVLPAVPAREVFVAGAGAIALAFPLLVAERFFGTVARSALPEAQDLKTLLFLPVAALLAAGLFEIAAGLGFTWVYWGRLVLALYLAVVSGELALRTLGVWFMPPPEPEQARAAIGCLSAKALRPATLSPEALVETIRDKFGIDFSRSWAIAYVRGAFAPVLLGMLVFCWFLTGVTSIGLDQRGSYERFGAPVAILKPGMHLVLPWPFGTVRRVDYGVVHSVLIGADAATGGKVVPDLSTAEDMPPASANRLWDETQGADVSYVIASASGDRQSFETVSADLRVLYRIGLDDDSARRAIYRSVDPAALVSSTSGRLFARFFAAETLDGVLGENRQAIADSLQAAEQRELDRLGSGIEIVSVVVEAIHPPSGAADAYHSVQAAQIVADTSISNERGRAESTSNVARLQARQTTNQAAGFAADLTSDAEVQLLHFKADADAAKAGGKAFLLERYFADLKTALPSASLEIVDDRLKQPDLPFIDLRPPGQTPPSGTTANGDQTP
jgi:regulator of protease activity HflC (stomatin/prohibitin superfamily)